MRKRIVIAAANGFIGSHLIEALASQFEVLTLTRRPFKHVLAHSNVLWDGKQMGAWTEVLEGSFAVINLSGKSVNCRHTKKNKAAILNSRLASTSILATAIEQCARPPDVWLNASGVSIYPPSFLGAYDEDTTDYSDDFLADVTKQWETACLSRAPETRKVVMRTAVVLGRNGGSFPLIRRLTRSYLGGKQGKGNQFFSWIHIEDYCQIVKTTLLVDTTIQGPVNMCAPEVVTNKEFMREVRSALGVPFGIPAPEFVLKIGGFVVGTEPSLVLKSTAVNSRVLKERKVKFIFPTLKEAVQNIAAPQEH